MTELAAKDLSVRIDGRLILDRVSLRVQAGAWLGVIGPNGAGKTTLLRALTGLVRATGDIELRGQPLGSLSRRERARQVALVPQTPIIPTGIGVSDYVLLGRTPHISLLGVERRHDYEIAAEVVELLDLGALAGRRVETLSGGERQRVLLARALAQEAPVLLLDEPTAALDIGHQQDVLELIDELRRERGLAVVSTMHDLTLAGRYPDRLLLLAGGRAVTTGTTDAVLTEQHLTQYYGAAVRIIRDEQGIVVVPQRPSPRSPRSSKGADR